MKNMNDVETILNIAQSPSFEDKTITLPLENGGNVVLNGTFNNCVFNFNFGAMVPNLNGLVETIQTDFLKDLFPEQRDLVYKCGEYFQDVNTRGQAICGTGFGKTFVVPYIIHHLVQKHSFTTFGFGLPWKNLANGSVIELLNTFKRLDLLDKYRIVLTHSDKELPEAFDEFSGYFLKSNDINEIVPYYNNSISQGKVVIFAVLYKSAHKLGKVLIDNNISLDFTIMDEAHNTSRDIQSLTLISCFLDDNKQRQVEKISDDIASLQDEVERLESEEEPIRDVLKQIGDLEKEKHLLYKHNEVVADSSMLPVNRILFVTATPTSSEVRGYRGMGNENVFGSVIFNMPFSKLADIGRVIRPTCRVLELDDSSLLNNVSDNRRRRILLTALLKSLQGIEAKLTENTSGKVVVYVSNTKDIEALTGEVILKEHKDNREYINLIESGYNNFRKLLEEETGRKYKIVGISSKMDAETRARRMKEFKECQTDIIMVNCKILSEGVSINDINAQVILRGSNSIEVSQINGRSCRLDPYDTQRIKDGSLISNGAYRGYKKDRAVLYVSNVRDTEEGLARNIEGVIECLTMVNNSEFAEMKWSGDIDRYHKDYGIVSNINNLAEVLSEGGEKCNEYLKSMKERTIYDNRDVEVSICSDDV